MRLLKRMLKYLFVASFVVMLQLALSLSVSALDREAVSEKLGKYSSWLQSVDGYTVTLHCPVSDGDEDYCAETVNDLFDYLKGEIGKDYCEVKLLMDYTVKENGSDPNAFSEKMFEFEKRMNVVWPEFSGRDGLNFTLGTYRDSDKNVLSYFVEITLKINGQDPNGNYAEYNEQLSQISSYAESSFTTQQEKVKYYCDWIKNNITYDLNCADANSACDALLQRRAVCGGFANLLRDLCAESDIVSLVPISTGLNHAWNEIYFDNTWYTVDLLNVVKSVSGNYTEGYFFTDPSTVTDVLDKVNKIKDKLNVYSFTCEDGLVWKTNTKADKISFFGKGEMADYDWAEFFPSWMEYDNINKIYINSGITSIGSYAFADYYYGTDTVTELYLPNTLKSVGEGAFSSRTAISSVYYDGTSEEWEKVNVESDNDVLYSAQFTFKKKEHIHSYGEWVTEITPTCTSSGLKYRVCSGCQNREEEVLLKSGHKYIDKTVLPTCTAKGYTTHKCSVCGYEYTDSYTDFTGHQMGAWIVSLKPTCTDEGERVRKCEKCVYEELEPIEPNGHAYEEIWTVDIQATCTTSGSESRHCENCAEVIDIREIEAKGHDYTERVTAPTCLSEGYTTYTCHCGYSYTDNIQKANGHSFGEWIKTETETCVKSGSQSRQCSECLYNEIKTISPLGHEYQFNWTIDEDATCTKNGEKSRHCERCSARTDILVITAPGHKYQSEKVEVTCLTDGYTVYTCHCGDTYNSDYVYATGHKSVTDNAVEATCTSTGLTQGEHCSVCGEVIIPQTVIEKLKHSYSAVVSDPTCTENGKSVYTCYCGDTYTEIIFAMGHDYSEDFITDKEATCEESGQKSRHCSRCGDLTDITEIFAKGHDFSVTVYQPSCTLSGYTYKKCKVCDYEENTDFIPAKNHSFDSWYTVKEATCVSQGIEHKKCSQCEFYDIRYVDKTPHTYVGNVTAPQCNKEGCTTYICSFCKDSYKDDYREKLSHSYTGETTPFENDTHAYKCVNGCDEYGEKVPCTDTNSDCLCDICGDDMAHNIVTDKYKEPSCCEYGLTEGKHCSICGEVIVKQDRVPMIKHDYSGDIITFIDNTHAFKCKNGCGKYGKVQSCVDENKDCACDICHGSIEHIIVIDEEMEATCLHSGLTQGSHCANCNKVFTEQEIIPQLGHCDEDENGQCDRCNEDLMIKIDCDCICHKEGIGRIFYKIFRTIWKFLGINKICTCGYIH